MLNYKVEDNIAIISFNMTDTPMNVLNEASIAALDAQTSKAMADDSVVGVIITSDKKEFIAGADLNMILKHGTYETSKVMITDLHRVFRKYEASGKTFVAAINGTILGGGYEVCLACHHRIAVNEPKTLIGLPEMLIGLFPGGGGTQRLPRMIGFEKALDFILKGGKVSPEKALEIGLVDALANTREEMITQAKAWIMANPHALQPWDKKDNAGKIAGKTDFIIPFESVTSANGEKLLNTQKTGNYPAPLAVMQCMYKGLQVPIEQGLAIEIDYFAQVATSKEARNMVKTVFFAMNEVNKELRTKNILLADAFADYIKIVNDAYLEERNLMLKEGISPVLIENACKNAGMSVFNFSAEELKIKVQLLKNQLSEEELKKRILYIQVIQAKKCLKQNVITSVRDADVASVLGFGFPAYTGGALSYVDYVGEDVFAQEGNRLASVYGERFKI